MTKTQIGTATVSNGIATTEYTIPSGTTPGEHNLHASYVENDTYEACTGYNTFHIRIGTETTVENVLASYGDTATFTAHVKYNTNQNVNEGTVQFQVECSGTLTNIGSPVNVSNGVATLSQEVLSTFDDDGEIVATFIQTSTYGSSTSSAGTLSIRDSVNVSVANVSANRSSTATITATITEADSDPVPTGQAQLYIDNTAVGEPETVSNGSVSFSYSVANNAVLGGHTIKVSYLQNSTYDPADGTAVLTVRTPTTLTPVDVSANKGSTIPITIRVTDPNNAAVTTGTVNITVGNAEAVPATVNSVTGEATINYSVPNDATGTISFSGAYVENDNYQAGATGTAGTITIRLGTTIVVDSIQAEIGDTIDLSSTVTDENSDAVASGTVNYEIE